MMSIRIMIYFIIVCSLPAASARTTDNVWASKSTGFINSSESLPFENYIIKAKILDNTKATITVYKDQNQMDISYFNINDFKRYDTIGVTLLGIKGDYSWISISKLESKEIWRPFARTLLKWGETYTIDNYTIYIDTFGSDSVNLTISNKNITEKRLFSKDDFKDYETFRIAVRDINRTGSIELEFFTNKATDIKTEIFTDKEEYFTDEMIQVTVNITSDAVQNIVGIDMESSPPVEIQPDRFSISGFTGVNSFYSQITRLPANSTVTITAKTQIWDFYNNPYVMTVSKGIFITPEVSIIKRVPADTDDENVPVQLYIYNSASNNKSIHIHDTVPEGLTAKELDWNIKLGPKKSITLGYNVTPEKPGLYILPAAIAQWEGRSSMSRTVNMTMHMPYISMTKTAVNNKNTTDVKLVISNTGDRPTQVKVSDRIPDGYSIISGNTTWSDLLESGKSATISYSLQGNIDIDLENLPAATAIYRDIRGVNRQAQSNAVSPKTEGFNESIDIKDNASTINGVPSEIMSFMVSSFIVITGIITGVALIAYLFARRR